MTWRVHCELQIAGVTLSKVNEVIDAALLSVYIGRMLRPRARVPILRPDVPPGRYETKYQTTAANWTSALSMVPNVLCITVAKTKVIIMLEQYATVKGIRSRENICRNCAIGPRNRAKAAIARRLPKVKLMANLCGDKSENMDIVKNKIEAAVHIPNPIIRCIHVRPPKSPGSSS